MARKEGILKAGFITQQDFVSIPESWRVESKSRIYIKQSHRQRVQKGEAQRRG